MNERTAFLAAICNDPANDAPRLAYADWLDEHGESDQAEFIRVQCRLAVKHAADELRGIAKMRLEQIATVIFEDEDLRNRERELLAEYQLIWAPSLYLLYPSISAEWHWSRGFVSRITCTWADWLRIADDVYWREVPCDACEGTGSRQTYDPASDTYRRTHGECRVCRGRGTVLPPQECPTCLGYGPIDADGSRQCDPCGGSGLIPRPCPETAQPISSVVFTSLPDISLDECKKRWIGVSFDVK